MQNTSAKKNYENDLTKGNVAGQMIKFSMPFMLSSFIQALYNTADMFIVSRYCGTGSISGVTIGSQVLMAVLNLIVGFTVGGTVLVAQYKGSQKPNDIKQTIGTLFSILIISSAVLTVSMLILCDPILRLVDTPEEAFKEAHNYFCICIGGTVFLFAYNAVSSVLRGMGDSKRPLVFIAVACASNVVLDYIFVGGLEMGASGAALATVIAQAISVVLSVIYLVRSDFTFDFKLSSFKIYKDKAIDIFKLGIPTSIQGFVVNGSFLVMTALVNQFGVEASTAVGIYNRYNSLAILPSIAIGQSVSAMAAQNIGACKPERAKKSMWVGIWLSLICSSVFFIIFELFPAEIIGVFSKDEGVIRYGVEYTRAIGADLLFTPFVFCMSNFANGTGHSGVSMVSSIASSLALRIPISYFFGKVLGWGMIGLGLGVPVATAGTVIGVWLYIATGRWKRSTTRVNCAASKS